MLMSKNFLQQIKQGESLIIPRKGHVNEVALSFDVIKQNMMDINIEGQNLVYSDGDVVHVLVDKFGIVQNSDDVRASFYFLEGGIGLELIKGEIILEAPNGELFTINHYGETGLLDKRNSYGWFTSDELYSKAEVVTQIKYHIPKEVGMEKYMHNILFEMVASYKKGNAGETGVSSVRFTNHIEALALGLVDFNQFVSGYASEVAVAPKQPTANPLGGELSIEELRSLGVNNNNDEDDDEDYSLDDDEEEDDHYSMDMDDEEEEDEDDLDFPMDDEEEEEETEWR